MSVRKNREGILLLAALAAVVLGTSWAWWRSAATLLPVPPGLAAALSSRAYQPAGLIAPAVKTERWADPSPQTRGADWIYDIFTPPAIYYHSGLGEFSVIPPGVAVEEVREDFGLELVGVRQEPFRLQLVGFVGGEGNYLGTFENVLTTEHFLARGRRRLPALGLTIVDFSVKPVAVSLPDRMPFAALAATAIVRDEQTGEEIILTNGERCYAGALVATVAPAGSPDERIDLRPGETVRQGDATFTLQQVRLRPPAADLVKASPGSSTLETKTLIPRP